MQINILRLIGILSFHAVVAVKFISNATILYGLIPFTLSAIIHLVFAISVKHVFIHQDTVNNPVALWIVSFTAKLQNTHKELYCLYTRALFTLGVLRSNRVESPV